MHQIYGAFPAKILSSPKQQGQSRMLWWRKQKKMYLLNYSRFALMINGGFLDDFSKKKLLYALVVVA